MIFKCVLCARQFTCVTAWIQYSKVQSPSTLKQNMQVSRLEIFGGPQRSCGFLTLSLLSHFLLSKVPLLEFHSLAWSYKEATIWVLMTVKWCLKELFFWKSSLAVSFAFLSYMTLLCIRTRVRITSQLTFDLRIIVWKVFSGDLSWVLNFLVRVKEILILVLQTKKSKFKETAFLFQGHIASKWRTDMCSMSSVFSTLPFLTFPQAVLTTLKKTWDVYRKKYPSQSPTPSDSNFIGKIGAWPSLFLSCPQFLIWERLVDSLYFRDTWGTAKYSTNW